MEFVEKMEELVVVVVIEEEAMEDVSHNGFHIM